MKNSVIAIMLLLILSGCTSQAYRAHPDIDKKIKYIRNPALIVPDVQVVSVSAGGVREIRDDWVAIGRDNITAALQTEFSQKKCRTKAYLQREDLQAEMEEIKALYRAVAKSVSLHVFGPYGFPDKQKNFNYSIGSLENILRAMDADALILVTGYDEFQTTERKAIQAAAAVAGALTGVILLPGSGMSYVDIAFIDRDGTILWNGRYQSQGNFDIRDPERVQALLKNVLKDFPKLEE